jgi:hypothetical protein
MRMRTKMKALEISWINWYRIVTKTTKIEL